VHGRYRRWAFHERQAYAGWKLWLLIAGDAVRNMTAEEGAKLVASFGLAWPVWRRTYYRKK
jgi:hypothetical protein